jgi:hypothetical protein
MRPGDVTLSANEKRPAHSPGVLAKLSGVWAPGRAGDISAAQDRRAEAQLTISRQCEECGRCLARTI